MTRNFLEKNTNAKPPTQSFLELQEIYKKMLVPMPLRDWEQVRNLEQPSILKRVKTKTVYGTTLE